jgi:hypothetical protein
VSEEHPNAVAYRKAAEAFRAGNLQAIETLVAEDIVWHVPGDHPMAGDIQGRQALLEWLGRVPGLGFWFTGA